MNTQTGIWKYESELDPKVEEKFRLTKGEGHTSLKKIENTWFKCEYENPTGSVKDRGLAFQLSVLYQEGVKKVAISSSGNAAISAVQYASIGNLELTIFISPHINEEKKSILQKLKAKIITSNRPVSDCIKYCNETKTYNLRPSSDVNGYKGYETIAFELWNQNQSIDAVFFPVSSGTTLKGVYEGYKKKGNVPKLYCVQSQAVHAIAEQFEKTNTMEKSIVDGIVARFTPLKEELITIIKKSGGSGIICPDEDVKKANKWLAEHGVQTSNEGALALAGLWKEKNKNEDIRTPTVLLTGKKYD